MKKLLTILPILVTATLFAQRPVPSLKAPTLSADNVLVGTNTPAASAIVNIVSTTKGWLGPRMTTTQRDAISSPATGLFIYNTTTNAFNYFDGSAWQPVGAGGGSGSVTSFSAGNLSPLFTTSVSNSTSTPALSFSLSNATARSVLGNISSSGGAPSYTTSIDLAGNGTIRGSFTLPGLSKAQGNAIPTMDSATGAFSWYPLTAIKSRSYSTTAAMQAESSSSVIYATVNGPNGANTYYYTTASLTPNGITILTADGKGSGYWVMTNMLNGDDSLGGASGRNIFVTPSNLNSSIGTVTLQQALTNGSTLLDNNTIINTGKVFQLKNGNRMFYQDNDFQLLAGASPVINSSLYIDDISVSIGASSALSPTGQYYMFFDTAHARINTDSIAASSIAATLGVDASGNIHKFATPSGGSGSGTVSSGTANRLAYYAANGTIVSNLSAITASRALASDANGLPVASSVTATELGYVSGVTSAIQTQLNAKAGLTSNNYTGAQTITNTTSPQFTIQYDGSNYVTHAVSSAGAYTIDATGSSASVNTNDILNAVAGLTTASTATNANLNVSNATSANTTTAATYLIGSNGNVGYRVGIRGSSSYNAQSNHDHAAMLIGQNVVNIASSGTHNIFASLAVNPLSIGTGAGTLTNSATLYVHGAASNATNNYAIWSTSGTNRFDGNIQLGGKISSTLDFGSTAGQSSSDLTITYSGASVGDMVALGVPNGSVNANSCYTAWVSATNTVTIRFNNYSSGAIDPASGTFTVFVWK